MMKKKIQSIYTIISIKYSDIIYILNYNMIMIRHRTLAQPREYLLNKNISNNFK